MDKLFNKKDVKIVAKAIVNTELGYIEDDISGYYYCTYCNKEHHTWGLSKNFKHDISCPVLVARDILTRI